MRLFQWLYDRWYRLTGNTQFGLARAGLMLAWGWWMIALILRVNLPLAITYGVLLLVITLVLPPMWVESERGWDPRSEDTKGNAYGGRWWKAARGVTAVFALVEFWLAAVSDDRLLVNVHFYYGLMGVAFMSALFFCVCNRREVAPRLVA